MTSTRHLTLVALMTGCNLLAADAEDTPVSKKALIDYFLPMAPQGPLVSEGLWGRRTSCPATPRSCTTSKRTRLSTATSQPTRRTRTSGASCPASSTIGCATPTTRFCAAPSPTA